MAIMLSVATTAIAIGYMYGSYQETKRAELEANHFHFEQPYFPLEQPKEILAKDNLKNLETLVL